MADVVDVSARHSHSTYVDFSHHAYCNWTHQLVQDVNLCISKRAAQRDQHPARPAHFALYAICQHSDCGFCWTVVIEDFAGWYCPLHPLDPIPMRGFTTKYQPLTRQHCLWLVMCH